MKEPASYSLSRYLRAKQSVDERALNRRVRHTFIRRLANRGEPPFRDLKILELAGGIGSTAARILDSIFEARPVGINYTLVDIDAELIAAAHDLLSTWGSEAGFEVEVSAERVVFVDDARTLSVRLVHGDAFEFLAETPPSTYDAVITQAWLDLVHLETALERIFRVLVDEGLFYAPIHFDGYTTFLPTHDGALDRNVSRLYHESMDMGRTPHGPPGGSDTGSRLLTKVPDLGARMETAGASDWIVYPRSDGCYPKDEAYFLHHVVQFVEDELADHPHLDAEAFRDWVRERRRQIDAGELIYIAHQLDVLARTP